MNGMRARRGRGDAITAVVRRVENRRAHQGRTVYVAEVFQDLNSGDGSTEDEVSTRRGRLALLSRQDPYGPVAGIVLRPLVDAATTTQILLRRW